jgi:hypothetical protein
MWQAGVVDPWDVGLVVVLIVGVAVIIYGAISDRRKNARLAQQMLSPPERAIPQFHADAVAPHYLTELQARRPEVPLDTTLDPARRRELQHKIASPSTITIEAGYLSADFVTDIDTSWAVLTAPRVLVCASPVTSIREILPILERHSLSRSPLVIVLPEITHEVQGTLEVNTLQHKLDLLVVRAALDQLQVVGGAVHATPVNQADLQAGYVPPEHLGQVPVWVSDRRRSYLLDVSSDSQASGADTRPAEQ